TIVIATAASADSARLGPEDFQIKTAGGQVLITGGGPRGEMYGCTALLEQSGVRWFTPKVTRIPANATITVPDLNERQSPAFEYREPFFTEALDRDWAARNRVNGNHANLDESTGGRIVYHPFVHSFDELIPKTLFDSHPEYFPLIDGKRVNGYVQRCLSNPDVLKIAIERVNQWIQARPDATIISVSQNDTGNWCTCEKCTEIVNRYGGKQSGLYIWF